MDHACTRSGLAVMTSSAERTSAEPQHDPRALSAGREGGGADGGGGTGLPGIPAAASLIRKHAADVLDCVPACVAGCVCNRQCIERVGYC